MSSRLAIVIPYYTNNLGEDERASLRHLARFLPDRDSFLLAPEGMDITTLGKHSHRIQRFPADFFTSTASYSRLLLSSDFYRAFARYEYILIYQLDCLAFTSDIELWLDTAYDYIGAPWFNDSQHAERGFSRVGNGGLSLRNVESFLRVLSSTRYVSQPVPFWADLFQPVYDFDEPMPALKLFWHRLKRRARVLRQVRRGVQWYTSSYSLNEDRFWSDRVMFFDPQFKIAPVRDGLRFAFERFPRYCYAQNGHQLPFGAHAWAKWDRAFWEPFLIQN
jgi:hypothetical protein